MSDIYTPTLNCLNKSIEELIDVSLEINDKSGTDISPLWYTHMSKFANVYSKVFPKMGIDAFYPMFIKFGTENLDFLTEPAWDVTTGKTGNEWLKSNELLDGPGFISKNHIKSTDGFDPILNSRCKGYVIYFNDNPDTYAVSIPISSIYNSAIKLCNKKEKDSDIVNKTYPIKVLRALYSIIYHSLPESDSKKLIENNIKLVSNQLELMIPVKTNKQNTGSGFNGVGKIIQQFMGAAGINNSGINADGIDGLIGNFMKGDGVEKITKVISQVSGAVRGSAEGGETADIGQIMGRISGVLAQPDIQATATSLSSGLGGEVFSGAPATTGIDPASQT